MLNMLYFKIMFLFFLSWKFKVCIFKLNNHGSFKFLIILSESQLVTTVRGKGYMRDRGTAGAGPRDRGHLTEGSRVRVRGTAGAGQRSRNFLNNNSNHRKVIGFVEIFYRTAE